MASIMTETNEIVVEETNTEDYLYSLDDERYFMLDDMMDSLREHHEIGEKVLVSRGTPKQFSHRDFINVDRIIDKMKDEAYDNVGELADDYLCEVDRKKENELEDMIVAWFDENTTMDFVGVENIEQVEIIVVE